jgi:hypothetical protein
MNQKVCSGSCKRKLDLNAENFQRDSSQTTGFKSRCKSCSRTVKSNKWPSVEAFDQAQGMVEVGKSTLRDRNGDIIAEWTKTAKEKEDEVHALLEAINALAESWDKPGPIKKPKGFLSDDLLNTIVLGDPHFGMFSWGQETGRDFDLEIAERNTTRAVDHLVGLAPKAKHALFISVGDFFHSDSSSNQTTKGTRVDVDTRWSKVLRVGIRAMRRCIDRLLETHETVHVILSLGNHDEHTSIMLGLALDQFYEREPRVTIDTTPGKFHYHRFGKCLFGVTHADTAKPKDLPGVMAVDQARAWGETEYRYWITGHLHHDVVRDYPGVTVETFRTLAPSDAWHKGQGYRSRQDLKLDIYHKNYGRINRHIVGIDQLDIE